LIDLKVFILNRQRKKQSIVLFIDANDHLPNSPFQRFRQDTDLIDIIAHERPDAPTATHMGGNRIDYILLSPDLAAGTTASGILPINHHVISDHRALYCDINVATLFSVKKIDELTHGTRRRLQMPKPTVVKKYLDTLEELYDEHRMLQRIQDLDQTI